MNKEQIEALSEILAYAFLEYKEDDPKINLSDNKEDVLKCVGYALTGK